MAIDQPDKFLHLTATGWTAIGSIISALSILALTMFNWLYLRAARQSADAAEASAAAAQRPVVVIHAEYSKDIEANLVWAHNQGNGPALDVQAALRFSGFELSTEETFAIGCLPADGKFQFLIGERSNYLDWAAIQYKAITDDKWTTKVVVFKGNPLATNVEQGHLYFGSNFPFPKDQP